MESVPMGIGRRTRMKFTETELKCTLEDFRAFCLDSFSDEMGNDCETAAEFIRRCAEAMESLEEEK